jgi:DNA-binding GntR family transcriptional regulator
MDQPVYSVLTQRLAERIADIIRRDGLAVGHRLKEMDLCHALGVSRSPIRKALQLLQTSGIVKSESQKGFQVARAPEPFETFTSTQEGLDEDALYLQIARDRLSGILAVELTESEIMARYGLARLQVQRIFNRMAREQLIDRKAGRGWAFRPWLDSVESHRESYRFRMILEPAAILEPGYQVNVAELKKCRREQEALLAGGIEKATHEQLYLAGVHLHETIAAGSNNRLILEALRKVNQLRRIVEYGTQLDKQRLHRQCEEHLTLIDLLLKGERMEASHFLRAHLGGANITKLGE